MGANAERLAAAMARFNDGDVEGFGDTILADEVVWHWPGRCSVSGEYRGRAAVIGLLQGFRDLASHGLALEPLDMLEGERHLMSFTRVRAERDGSRLEVTMADAMRFDDRGLIVEYWTLSNDQAAVDAFIG